MKQNKNSSYKYNYNYNIAFVFLIPTISSDWINNHLIGFINFLNNNLLVIFSSLLVLGLLLIYTSDKYNSFDYSNSTKTTNANILPSSSSDDHDSAKDAVIVTSAAAGASALIVNSVPASIKSSETIVGIASTAIAVILIYLSEKLEKTLVERNEGNVHSRPESPYSDGNFKINSPNEDNNIFNKLSDLYDIIINGMNNGFDEFFSQFVTKNGDPTIVCMFAIVVCLFSTIFSVIWLIMSQFAISLKIENKEFVIKRPLLHKIVLYFIKLRYLNQLFILFLVLIQLVLVLFLCNTM